MHNPKPASRWRQPVYYLLILAILFYCLDYFFRISPSLVLPQLLVQYHMSPFGIASMASAFYLGYVLLQLPAGWLFDRFSFNIVMIVSIVICVICYTVFLLATDYALGLFTRFLIGASSAFSFIGVLHLARTYIPLRYFSFISGITIALGTVSAAFAQFISALFLALLSWKMIFLIIALGGFVIAVMMSLTYLNIRYQHRINHESLPIQLESTPHSFKTLLCSPSFMINAFIGGLIYLPTSIFAGLWGISFLNLGYHLSAEESSFAILLLFIGWAIGSPLVGWWSETNKSYLLVLQVASLLLAGVTFIFVAYPEIIGHSIFILLLVFGLLSSFQVLVWRHFNAICPTHLSATGIALTNMVIMLSTSILHFIAGKWIGDTGDTVHFQQIQHGLFILPFAFIVATLLLGHYCVSVERTNSVAEPASVKK